MKPSRRWLGTTQVPFTTQVSATSQVEEVITQMTGYHAGTPHHAGECHLAGGRGHHADGWIPRRCPSARRYVHVSAIPQITDIGSRRMCPPCTMQVEDIIRQMTHQPAGEKEGRNQTYIYIYLLTMEKVLKKRGRSFL